MANEFIEEQEAMGIAPAISETGIVANGFFNKIIQDVNENGFYSTFDVSTTKGAKKLYKATNASELLREYMQTPIEVADIAFAPTEVTDEEGFSKTTIGVFIIATDGTAYMSSSNGVIKSAMKILAQFGLPDTWDEPLTVICKETNTAKGRRYKFLDVE